MNVYKDFVAVHNMKADPRDIKIFVDWLLATDPGTQAHNIGEAMQTAMDNYIEDNETQYLKEMI